MKRILGMVAVGVVAVALTMTGLAPASANARSGVMHVTKECSQYDGSAGAFCTITASNIHAIKPGAKVVYASAANADGTLDSDIVVDNGHGNRLFGHVTLNATIMHIWFAGGTGVFRHFTGSAVVTVSSDGLWHWDGSYRFRSDEHESSGDHHPSDR